MTFPLTAVRPIRLFRFLDKQVRDLSRRVQILLISRMDIRKNKSVHRPALPSRPTRPFRVALSASRSEYLVRLRGIVHNDMVNRTVLANVVARRHVRLRYRYILKSIVLYLFARPIQQRNIKHTVDNRPALAVFNIPSADKFAFNIVSARQHHSGNEVIFSRTFIPRQPIGRTARQMKHKPNVVMQTVDILFKAPL